MCTKKHNHMMYVSWDMEYERHFFLSFWAIFCPFTPLLTLKIKIWNKCKKTSRYYPIKHVYHKWRSYNVWFLRYKKRQSFLSFWAIFCPLTLLTTWKIKVLKKMKKTPEDIIILHLHNTNDDHMMYSSWDKEHSRQNFLSFWTIFCPFTPPTTSKTKIWKNE